MRDAALLDGDLVVVEQHTPPRSGDIVVAVVDDEVAIKYLRSDPSNRYFLESANPAYPPIRPLGSLEVLGVVVGVVRRLRR
jgi:repressor LexA